MVFKLVEGAQKSWRLLDGHTRLELLDRDSGAEFVICAQNRTSIATFLALLVCYLFISIRMRHAMQVHIFRGPDRIFGFTAHPDGTNLPSRYAPWTAFKTIDLTAGTTKAGVNVTECLDDIEKHGFHLTAAHVRITERAVQNP
jgi:hypothetical protein